MKFYDMLLEEFPWICPDPEKMIVVFAQFNFRELSDYLESSCSLICSVDWVYPNNSIVVIGFRYPPSDDLLTELKLRFS